MTALIGRRDFITLLGAAASWPLATITCGEKRADTSKVFQEHEQFVEFGRHLARQSGIEETFRLASYVSAQVSARHIRESCPSLWNSWLVQVSALIGVGLLGVVLAVVYKRTGIKPAPT